jgi:hypothetical protein
MDNTSSSNESTDHSGRRGFSVLDVWMVAATLFLMAGYLLIPARKINYVYVARWVFHLISSFFGK